MSARPPLGSSVPTSDQTSPLRTSAPEWIPAMSDVVALTCNDQAIELGLIKPATEPPADSTDTERLMALAGRTIARQ